MVLKPKVTWRMPLAQRTQPVLSDNGAWAVADSFAASTIWDLETGDRAHHPLQSLLLHQRIGTPFRE